MSRVQLALRVPDLTASIAFYTKLFGTEPTKLRDGYANFAIAEPPLKLVLVEGNAGEDTRMDHLGVEVESTDAVHAATTRLSEAGLVTAEENDTTCWLRPPGQGLGPRPRPGTLGGVCRQGRRRLPDEAGRQYVLYRSGRRHTRRHRTCRRRWPLLIRR